MKKIWKRIAGMMLALTMVVSMIPVQASAASVYVPSSTTIVKYSAKDTDVSGGKLNKSYLTSVSGSISNLKSSDTKIVKVSTSKINGYTYIYLTAKKKGTATVSFKYKSKTYKVTVNVQKYKNPVSSIKVGNNTIKGSKFDSSANYSLKYSTYKNKKIQFKAKAAKGWTVTGGECMQKGAKKSDFVQNGKKTTVKGGKGYAFAFYFVNDETGVSETVVLHFSK